MKKKRILLLLLISFAFITSGFIFKNKKNHRVEDKWSGTVSLVIVRIDSGKAEDFSHKADWYEKNVWRMEADIINNSGMARSIIKGNRWGKSIDKLPPYVSSSATDTTFGRGEDSTELLLGIIKEDNEYGFSVDIPATLGFKIRHSIVDGVIQPIIREDLSEAETQILIERQQLGSNPDILTGKIIEKDTLPSDPGNIATITTTREWKLTRSGKKNTISTIQKNKPNPAAIKPKK